MEKPIRKPPSSAANSAAAFTRHQNQRSTSTTPGPVPMAITRRNTVPMLVLINAVITANTTNNAEANWPTNSSSRWLA